MARKVLISFLGTGPLETKETRTYKTANYHIGETILGEYPFVSAALIKYYQIDKVILVGTTHSMWEEVYRWFCDDSENPMNDDIYFEIAQSCEKSNYTSELVLPHKDIIEKAIGRTAKIALIKYGITEEEIRDNTDIILGLQQYLNKGDELIVDVTHSFRSLPMFMMYLLIYLKNVSNKSISISHVHYGMLEMYKELGYAPIIDLNSMMEVNDWITGAYSFSEFGNAYKISELIKNQDKSVSKLLDEFSNLMNLNHLHAIQKISQRLSSIKNREYQTLLPQLTINPIVDDFIKRFYTKEVKHSMFQLKVARWQLDHRKYAQAILTINEAMITYVCEINNFQWDNFDYREGAKAALSYHYPESVLLKCDKDLKQIYKRLKPLRNCTAHSLETDKNVSNMLDVLNESVSQIESILNISPERQRTKTVKGNNRSVLINFSNHPSANWSSQQLEAAKDYGTIEDLPFPMVDPKVTEKELQKLATDYVQQIMKLGEGNNIVIHVMGEMTLTFLVVTQLKALGIKCIASTTDRIATENNDGTKLSEFSFVRFREY